VIRSRASVEILHDSFEKDAEGIHGEWHASEETESGRRHDPPAIEHAVMIAIHMDLPLAELSKRAIKTPVLRSDNFKLNVD